MNLKMLAPFLALLFVAPAPAQDGSAAIIARIEAAQTPDRGGLDAYTLTELMHRFHVNGVSIAVVRDFKIEWAKGYGLADVETGRPVETTTTFQAASISKPVTAMAAMRLVEEGRFSIDEDVNKILKSWKVPESDLTRGHPVTPRSLMSHTSGADDGFGFPGYDPSAPRPTLVQIIEGQKPSNVGPVLFTRPPFEAYKYSGGGVTIMQLALMDLTGEPFAEMMRRLVLDPLGMRDSSYEQPPPPDRAAHASHAYNGEGKSMGPPWHVYAAQAAAGLWTTPSDLARFLIEVERAVRGPKGAVLDQASATQMIAPVGVGPFAVGLEVGKRGEGWYFTHSGGNWGFQCDLLAHFRKGYGVVIMTNSDRGGIVINELESRVAAAYNWDSLAKPLFR
ncbi:MAG TPA: serine hydrolase domain-containing protein [Bryobacteraceae bacterium]|nr:serine hydrolase domain-containing protein [Bryobacteraceae bacterium]